MKTNRELYRYIINELENIYEQIKDKEIKTTIEEIANSVDEIFDSMAYKIETLCEDIDMLEEKVMEYERIVEFRKH